MNYIIILAFFGNLSELLRLPQVAKCLFQIAFAKSKAEFRRIDSDVRGEFYFGESYSQILLIFIITNMSALQFPIMTLPGLFYLITKYYVDRHNIMYFFERSSTSVSVHQYYIFYFLLAPFVGLLNLLIFAITEKSPVKIGVVGAMLLWVVMIWVAAHKIKLGHFKENPCDDFNWNQRQEQEEQEELDSEQQHIPNDISYVSPLYYDVWKINLSKIFCSLSVFYLFNWMQTTNCLPLDQMILLHQCL